MIHARIRRVLCPVLSACLLASGVGCQSARERADDRVALVRVGMERAEVSRLLGEPDDRDFGRNPAGEEIWKYTYGQGIGRTVGNVVGILIVMAPFILFLAAAARSGNTGLDRFQGPWMGPPDSCTVQVHFNPVTGSVARIVIK